MALRTPYVVQLFEMKREPSAALPTSHLERLRAYRPLADAVDAAREALGARHVGVEPRRHAGPVEGAALAAIFAFAAAGGTIVELVEHVRYMGSPPRRTRITR